MPFSNPTPSHSPGARASSPAPTFSHAHPVSVIINASLTGNADVSSAAPLTHAHPATPSANTPCNKQQTTNNEPSPAPQTSASRSALHTPPINSPIFIFRIAFDIALTVMEAIQARVHALPLAQSCNYLHKLTVLIYRITAVQVTLIRKPERFTPSQLARLAKVSAIIERLAGRTLPFLAGTADGPVRSPVTPSKPTPPSPTNPPSTIRTPQSAIRDLKTVRVIAPLMAPGATLARIFQQLAALQARLPQVPASSPPAAPAPPRATSQPTPNPQQATPTPQQATNNTQQATNNPQQATDNERQTTGSPHPAIPLSSHPFSSALRNQIASLPFSFPLAPPAAHGRHHPPP